MSRRGNRARGQPHDGNYEVEGKGVSTMAKIKFNEKKLQSMKAVAKRLQVLLKI